MRLCFVDMVHQKSEVKISILKQQETMVHCLVVRFGLGASSHTPFIYVAPLAWPSHEAYARAPQGARQNNHLVT